MGSRQILQAVQFFLGLRAQFCYAFDSDYLKVNIFMIVLETITQIQLVVKNLQLEA